MILPNINVDNNPINMDKLSIEDERYLSVLNLFSQQNEFTRRDVEEVMGIGTTHVINMIKEMIGKNLIAKIGQGKNTRYIKKK